MATEQRGARSRQLVLATIGGLAVGLGLAVALLVYWSRGDMPPLTRARLDEAIARWEQYGPSSYDLDVVIRGRQPGTVHIEVRRGEVVAMTRNGRTPAQRRTWEFWTVPRQLESLEIELEAADDPQRGFGAPAGARVVQRAIFHPDLGYPLRYERIVLGTPLEVEWETVHFAIERDDAPPSSTAAPREAALSSDDDEEDTTSAPDGAPVSTDNSTSTSSSTSNTPLPRAEP